MQNGAFRLFIGANNSTGLVEREKIEAVMNAAAEAYTLYDAVGYWRGNREPSIVCEIAGVTREQVLQIAQQLKAELQQEAIGLATTPLLEFV